MVLGAVYIDLNASGFKDPGEGLAGWVIHLDGPATATALTATTDVDGNFSFVGLAGDTYTVCEEQQAAFVQLKPVEGSLCYTGGLGYSVVIPVGNTFAFGGNDFVMGPL
jgi:hypothetical protein